jgi:hypothetical protein
MLSVIMLSAIMLSVIMLSAIMLSVIMQSVFMQSHYAACHYAEFLYAEFLYAEFLYAEFLNAEFLYAEFFMLSVIRPSVFILSVMAPETVSVLALAPRAAWFVSMYFQIAKGAKASALAVNATKFFTINIVNFSDQLRQILLLKQQSKESFTAIKMIYYHSAHGTSTTSVTVANIMAMKLPMQIALTI